jgi:hypothetical protein
MAIDISNPLEWNLIERQSIVSDYGWPFPFVFQANFFEIAVGIRPKGKPDWHYGGYLNQKLIATPSTAAELGVNLVQVASFRLSCNQWQGIELADAQPFPYACQIVFPPYFRSVDVEIYGRNDL